MYTYRAYVHVCTCPIALVHGERHLNNIVTRRVERQTSSSYRRYLTLPPWPRARSFSSLASTFAARYLCPDAPSPTRGRWRRFKILMPRGAQLRSRRGHRRASIRKWVTRSNSSLLHPRAVRRGSFADAQTAGRTRWNRKPLTATESDPARSQRVMKHSGPVLLNVMQTRFPFLPPLVSAARRHRELRERRKENSRVALPPFYCPLAHLARGTGASRRSGILGRAE